MDENASIITSAPVAPEVRRRPRNAGVLLIVLFLIASAVSGAAWYFQDRVYLGVKMDGISLGGLTRSEAKPKIALLADRFINSGFTFSVDEKGKHVADTLSSAADPLIKDPIVSYDIDQAVAAAYNVGRGGSLTNRLHDIFSLFQGGKKVPIPFTIDRKKMKQALIRTFGTEDASAANASLDITVYDGVPRIEVVPERMGLTFDYEGAIRILEDDLRAGIEKTIPLTRVSWEPEITTSLARTAIDDATAALRVTPLIVAAEDKRATITDAALASALTLVRTTSGVRVGVDPEKGARALREIAGEYDIPASNTSFEIDPITQKMTKFSQGRDGRHINIDSSLLLLETLIADAINKKDTVSFLDLPVEPIKSKVITASGEGLGIMQALGVGRSNFKGSPTNRIKNIRHGIAKLNGILIAPDEEFSLLAKLGPFTQEDGYLPEKVIKGDQIKAEIGGGLCQIGTTTFRTIMASGLPVLARQNHSLVVSYYNDPGNRNPGTDATIYDPAPDLKFKNDTGHWILITTDINLKTSDLAFTFWGTPDGRIGSYTPPKVIRWINPPEKKVIETSSLEPGKEECQHSYRGADTTFTYIITLPDGTRKEQVFPSHYRALPEICLVGKAIPTATADSIPILPPEAAVGN